MSEPYVGEIRMFGGTFAPRGWAFCDGQLLAVSQNDALFSLLGTTYGGDGRTTFGLPDLRGRVPIHQGSNPGGSTYRMGQKSGQENVTLLVSNMPNHTHTFQATTTAADSVDPTDRALAASNANLYVNRPPSVQMHSGMVQPMGGNLPHNNMMPFLTIHFIIALVGIYPSQH